MPYYTDAMWRLIEERAPRRIPVAVEIGTFKGEWASNVLKRFPIDRLFCVDPWHHKGGEQTFAAWIERVKPWLFERVFPLRGTSEQWQAVFDLPIDLLYIDAVHKYHFLYNDLRWWVPKVREGGLIIGHDYNRPPPRAAVRHYFGSRQHYVISGPCKVVRGKYIEVRAFWKLKEASDDEAAGPPLPRPKPKARRKKGTGGAA